MTRIEVRVDTPWWLMRWIGKKLKAHTKVLCKYQHMLFTKWSVFLFITGTTSFKFTLHRYELSLNLFNVELAFVRE